MAVQYYKTAPAEAPWRVVVQERIARINAIIDALLLAQIDNIGKEGVLEYSLDDGQTKISTTYRSTSDISQAVMALERIKQVYDNQLRGRVTRLIDSKNLPGRSFR